RVHGAHQGRPHTHTTCMWTRILDTYTPHTHTNTRRHIFFLSLSDIHTRTHTHRHTQAQTHTSTHTQTHTHNLFHSKRWTGQRGTSTVRCQGDAGVVVVPSDPFLTAGL